MQYNAIQYKTRQKYQVQDHGIKSCNLRVHFSGLVMLLPYATDVRFSPEMLEPSSLSTGRREEEEEGAVEPLMVYGCRQDGPVDKIRPTNKTQRCKEKINGTAKTLFWQSHLRSLAGFIDVLRYW